MYPDVPEFGSPTALARSQCSTVLFRHPASGHCLCNGRHLGRRPLSAARFLFAPSELRTAPVGPRIAARPFLRPAFYCRY